MDRRRFLLNQLRAAAAAGAAGWAVPFARAADGSVRPVAARPVPARLEDIDRFEHAHALRDGRTPLPAEPSEECDVVIVGGGLSGLVAAHRLRGRKLVVLEKEDAVGGNSRSREIAGCRYALGAFLSQGPVAPFTDFFAQTDAAFIRLEGRDHALHQSGRTVPDPLGAGLAQLPWPAADRAALRTALERLAPLADPQHGLAFPMENGAAALRAFDRGTQWAQFDREQLPARVRQLFDVLLSARVGDSGERLSAWYGNYLLANLLVPSYTMRGGHGDYSRRLAASLQAAQPNALRTGFTVLRVEPQGDAGVRVTGIDAQGRAQSIAARCAVVGTPKHLAKHLVPGLREQRAPAYGQFHYNAYLVAQVQLGRPIDAPFETVLPDARCAKFVVAPDALPGNRRRDGGGLRTVYAPFPRVEGRMALLQPDAERLAADIAADLRGLSPEYADAIDEIVLHRWGHPMLTAAPGMSDALASAREPEGRIVFAHSDNLGITGLYSAVWAGMSAETDAELILS